MYTLFGSNRGTIEGWYQGEYPVFVFVLIYKSAGLYCTNKTGDLCYMLLQKHPSYRLKIPQNSSENLFGTRYDWRDLGLFSRKGINLHKVPECLSLRRNWVPPPPPPYRVCLPPGYPKDGRATLAYGWGGGRTQFGRLDRKPGTLYTLWCSVKCAVPIYGTDIVFVLAKYVYVILYNRSDGKAIKNTCDLITINKGGNPASDNRMVAAHKPEYRHSGMNTGKEPKTRNVH